jgi:hypothetical protein
VLDCPPNFVDTFRVGFGRGLVGAWSCLDHMLDFQGAPTAVSQFEGPGLIYSYFLLCVVCVCVCLLCCCFVVLLLVCVGVVVLRLCCVVFVRCCAVVCFVVVVVCCCSFSSSLCLSFSLSFSLSVRILHVCKAVATGHYVLGTNHLQSFRHVDKS